MSKTLKWEKDYAIESERRLRVGIDVDDVVANFIERFMNLANEMFGVDPTVRPVDWAWSNLGLTKEQIVELWEKIKTIPYFWEGLRPLPEAVESIYNNKDDFMLFFITARREFGDHPVEQQTAAWLYQHAGVPFPTVIISDKKGPVANALELDVFIDDRGKNCDEVKAARPECRVFLKDSSHNQTYTGEARRVSGVEEMFQILKEEKNGRHLGEGQLSAA